VSSSLGRHTARSAAWSVGSQAVTVAVGTLSTAILARLLTPADFGLVAMVVAIIGFGELFRDFGLTNAVIQAPTVSRAEKTNLFWVNTLIGFSLTFVVYLLAEPIASYYQRDEVARVVRVLSLAFLINGIATQPRANLVRDLRMRAIAVVDVLSVIFALILSVALAIAGAGVWSLVGLQLGRLGMTLVASVIADGFLPGLPDRSTNIQSFMQFGMFSFAARIPVFISMNIDSVLIGRVLGAQTLGLYSRAYQLALMPTQQLTGPLSRVMLPTLSRLKNSTDQYNRALLRSQSIMTTIAAIGYASVIVFAAELVRIFLGPDWSGAVPIFQVLALVGLIDSANNLTYWVFISKGIPKQHLYYSLIGRPILIVAVVIMVQYGVTAIAWTYACWIAVAWVFGVWWAGRSTDIPVMTMIVDGARTFLMSLVLIAVGLMAKDQLDYPAVINVIFTCLIMLTALAAIFAISPAIRRDIRNTIAVKDYFKKPDTRVARVADYTNQ